MASPFSYRCTIELKGVSVSALARRAKANDLVEVHVYSYNIPPDVYQKCLQDTPFHTPFTELVLWLDPKEVTPVEEPTS